jgi:GldM N-terminal domain
MTSIRQLTARGSVGLLLGGLAACQSGPSAAELRQLYVLDTALQLSNARLTRDADGTVGQIERNVSLTRWQARDVAVLRQAQQVQARARAEVQYLRRLRQSLLAGGPTAAVLAESAPLAALLPGSGGATDTLQRRLNGYARYVQQFLPAQDTLLAADARHDPRIREAVGKDLDDWRFGELQFRDASVASALATLARQEAEVIRREREVLRKLAEKVGSSYIVFDKISLMAVPESNTVREGDTYRATMYLTTTGSEVYDLRMTANGQPIKADYRRQSLVQLPIPADAAAGPARWEGAIQGHYHGRDTTFRVQVPYTIQPR